MYILLLLRTPAAIGCGRFVFYTSTMFTPRTHSKFAFLCIFSVCALLGTSTPSHADTSSSTDAVASSTPNTTPAGEVRVVELRGRFTAQTKNRIKNLLENIVHRGNATVARFAQISTRIDARIQKIKAQGGDTSAAEAALSEANSARSAADDILRTLTDRDVDVVVDAPVPHDALHLLSTRITDVHAHLTTAKDALARAAHALTATPVPTIATTTAATTTRTRK